MPESLVVGVKDVVIVRHLGDYFQNDVGIVRAGVLCSWKDVESGVCHIYQRNLENPSYFHKVVVE